MKSPENYQEYIALRLKGIRLSKTKNFYADYVYDNVEWLLDHEILIIKEYHDSHEPYCLQSRIEFEIEGDGYNVSRAAHYKLFSHLLRYHNENS